MEEGERRVARVRRRLDREAELFDRYVRASASASAWASAWASGHQQPREQVINRPSGTASAGYHVDVDVDRSIPQMPPRYHDP